MHKFLRSIGFSKLKDLDDQDVLLQDVLSHYDFKKVVETKDNHVFAEISKEYAPDTGITVCGEYDSDNLFHMEYYFPFFWGSHSVNYETIAVDPHIATTSFAGACEDMRIGTTLIFYLSNAGEYITAVENGTTEDRMNYVSFAALAEDGTVLLPVSSDRKAGSGEPQAAEFNSLFEAAQSGDKEAIKSLTKADLDLIASLNHRVQSEDIYTIVDSYFTPFGMECDLYSILGEIQEVTSMVNPVTDERLYHITVSSNGLPVDVCINALDLRGVPEPGRRFKGHVWLQGKIDFF